MKDPIRTALHKIDWSVLEPEKQVLMNKAAKYFVDEDVVGIMNREDTMKSIQALVEANLLRLPFDPILIEFNATKAFRRFVILRQNGEDFLADSWFWHFEKEALWEGSQNSTVMMNEDAFLVTGVVDKQDAHSIIVAVTMALLFLNVTGIEKQVVTPTGLNRSRIKRGLSPVPTVTTMRIGTVYDRSGNPVKGAGGVAGHRRVHMRAGHTRRQHYGVGNAETKIIYVPPVVVNYKPGDAMPALPSKRVKL